MRRRRGGLSDLSGFARVRLFCRRRVLARRIPKKTGHPVGLGRDYNEVMLRRQTISYLNAGCHMEGVICQLSLVIC